MDSPLIRCNIFLLVTIQLEAPLSCPNFRPVAYLCLNQGPLVSLFVQERLKVALSSQCGKFPSGLRQSRRWRGTWMNVREGDFIFMGQCPVRIVCNERQSQNLLTHVFSVKKYLKPCIVVKMNRTFKEVTFGLQSGLWEHLELREKFCKFDCSLNYSFKQYIYQWGKQNLPE